ncbi:unnamed protein product [Phytomonas sp. EM1]|nr:unnamed protein product [Phytomonas sp. EM1]|eukprot:CCW59903.1 unnamed protein product [Phytomonas sp. isolate EM1]
MSSHEEAVTALYAQRITLVKQLAEIDTNIKQLESKLHKESCSPDVPIYDELNSEDADVEKFRRPILNSLKDASGLRDALKVADACKQVQQLGPDGSEAVNAKIHFRNVFIHEAISLAPRLCMDPNGSELIRHIVSLLITGTTPARLYKAADAESYRLTKDSELMLLMEQLSADIFTLMCDTIGSRVAQKITDSLQTLEEFDMLSRSIVDHAADLAMDINGNHVLMRLVTSSRLNEFHKELETPEQKEMLDRIHKCIFKEITEKCVEISKNRQGCCVVQKCLQWAPEPYYSTMINTVLNNTLGLVQDSFGNYVIQFILDRHNDLGVSNPGVKSTDYTNHIIRQMLHHVAELSCNKFSSNVIEKCLKTASPDVRQLLVDELTEPQVLPKLLTDSFANYVIQTAISTASGEGQFTQLRDSIMPLQNLLKHSPYGVKIETKLSRRNRESSRRQAKKREASTSTYSTPSARPDHALNPSYMRNLSPAMPALMSADGAAAVGPPVTLANLPPDVSLFQQQHMMGSMQFVFHGSQQFIGIPGAQSPFMNVLGGNRTSHEYQ